MSGRMTDLRLPDIVELLDIAEPAAVSAGRVIIEDRDDRQALRIVGDQTQKPFRSYRSTISRAVPGSRSDASSTATDRSGIWSKVVVPMDVSCSRQEAARGPCDSKTWWITAARQARRRCRTSTGPRPFRDRHGCSANRPTSHRPRPGAAEPGSPRQRRRHARWTRQSPIVWTQPNASCSPSPDVGHRPRNRSLTSRRTGGSRSLTGRRWRRRAPDCWRPPTRKRRPMPSDSCGS